VGEVRLPDPVGRRRLEPDPGAPGPLARLGDDEPGGVQDPPDRGGRGDREALAPEVPGDRRGAGVEAVRGEPRPQRHDPAADGVRDRVGARARPPGPRLEAVDPALPVPAQEPVQVLAADAALRRRCGDGQLP
jgi:hypothetical protein